MEKIVVKSTKKKYLIIDQFDNELGVIEIDPTDTNIAKRAVVAKDNILAYINEASKIADTENTDDAIDKITEIDKKIKTEINNLFNYDVAAVVFGETHCLSTSNGVTFVENFLEAITPVIEREFNKEQKASNDRISKYTQRYKNDRRSSK